MFRGIFRVFGKLLIMAATGLFTAAFVALGASCFMLTWPFIHGGSKRRKIRAAVELAGALGNFVSTVSADRMLQIAQRAMEQATEDDA